MLFMGEIGRFDAPSLVLLLLRCRRPLHALLVEYVRDLSSTPNLFYYLHLVAKKHPHAFKVEKTLAHVLKRCSKTHNPR